MKQRPGKDIMVFGSGSIVSQLTQHGLIDEYQFVVCPVFLGNGRRLLDGREKSLKLELLAAREYQSGDVLLRYAPKELQTLGDQVMSALGPARRPGLDPPL